MNLHDHGTRSGNASGDGTAAQRDDLYRLLVQHVKDYAIFLLDPHGYVRTWNEGAQRIKGYQAHEIIGQHFSRFYPPEEVQRGTPAHGLRVAAVEGRWEQEGWRVRQDGSRFWADVVITALYAEVGTLVGFAKVTRDLTERKHAEEERLRLVEHEQQAWAAAEVAAARVRMQEEFLAIAAHELKTPLAGAKIAAQLLLRRAAKQGAAAGDGPQQQALHTIDQQLARLGRLVEQLLETTRLHTGRLTLHRAPANVTALVGTAAQAAQARAEQQEIDFSAPDALWASVDADRLEQVVTNLLDNALKFSASGQRIEVQLIRSNSGPQSLHLSVRDYGIGVPVEHRPHLFERFYQAHPATHRSGLGLGLYISRAIVVEHGGTIAAEFPPEGGTRLVVTLPLSPPEGALDAGTDAAVPRHDDESRRADDTTHRVDDGPCRADDRPGCHKTAYPGR
jgi:PAS domain S-box-containing protein